MFESNHEFLDVAQVNDFYNESKMANTGEASFYRALKIPKSFFLAQSPKLQNDLLNSQKAQLISNGVEQLHILKDAENTVLNVTPAEETDVLLDPLVHYNLTGLVQDVKVKYDFYRGHFQYDLLPDIDTKDDYVYRTVMMGDFYQKNESQLLSGVYKMICSNGVILPVSEDLYIKFELGQFDANSIVDFVNSYIQSAQNKYSVTNEKIESLKNESVDLNALMDETKLFYKENRIVRTVSKAVMKRLVDYENGFNPEESDIPLPASMNTRYDYFDLYTYQAHELSAASSQREAEKQIHKVFLGDAA